MSRRVILLAVVGLLVVVLGWYAAVWSPEQSSLKSARAKGVTAIATQTQLSSQLGGLRRLQKELPADAAALGQSLPALPTAVSVDTAIDQIDMIADATGVQWSNESQSVSGTPAAGSTSTTTPAGSSSAASPGASTVALTLTVLGSYRAVTAFISALEVLPRLIVIDTLSYAPGGSTVSADITGRAFYDPTAVPVIPMTVALTSVRG